MTFRKATRGARHVLQRAVVNFPSAFLDRGIVRGEPYAPYFTYHVRADHARYLARNKSAR